MTGTVQDAQYWLAQAARDLRSARLLLDDGDADGSANRLYYAMFHAVTAAFAGQQRMVKTHDGLVAAPSAATSSPPDWFRATLAGR